MTQEQMSRDQFVQFVRDARLGVVATVDRDGRPEAAVMDLAVLGDGTLLFETKSASRKVDNLFSDARVAIVVGWDPVSLQIEGQAELLLGIEREAMAGLYESQLPHRPAVGEAFSLYRVVPEWLRRCEHIAGRPPQVVEGLWG